MVFCYHPCDTICCLITRAVMLYTVRLSPSYRSLDLYRWYLTHSPAPPFLFCNYAVISLPTPWKCCDTVAACDYSRYVGVRCGGPVLPWMLAFTSYLKSFRARPCCLCCYISLSLPLSLVRFCVRFFPVPDSRLLLFHQVRRDRRGDGGRGHVARVWPGTRPRQQPTHGRAGAGHGQKSAFRSGGRGSEAHARWTRVMTVGSEGCPLDRR